MIEKPGDLRGTPQWFFNLCDQRWQFDLDAAANEHNTKCSAYLTIRDNALVCDWCFYKAAWCNPPYSKVAGGLSAWCRAGHHNSRALKPVVMLIPADCSTEYFSYCFHNAATIYLINKRLKFDADNGAKFPSMLVEFRGTMPAGHRATVNLIHVTPEQVELL